MVNLVKILGTPQAYDKALKHGDFSELTEILMKNPEDLHFRERELIARKLRGTFKVKRGKKFNKQQYSEMLHQAKDINQCYLWLVKIDNFKPYLAHEDLAVRFNESESTIRNRLNMFNNFISRKAPETRASALVQAGLMLELAFEDDVITNENFARIKQLSPEEQRKYKPQKLHN